VQGMVEFVQFPGQAVVAQDDCMAFCTMRAP